MDSNRIAACANTRLPTLLPNRFLARTFLADATWNGDLWARTNNRLTSGILSCLRSVSGRLGRVPGRAARTWGRRSSVGGAPPAGVGRHLLAGADVLDLAVGCPPEPDVRDPAPVGVADLAAVPVGLRGDLGRDPAGAQLLGHRDRVGAVILVLHRDQHRGRHRAGGDQQLPGRAAGRAAESRRSRVPPRDSWCARRWRASRSGRRRRSRPRTRSPPARSRTPCRCSSPDPRAIRRSATIRPGTLRFAVRTSSASSASPSSSCGCRTPSAVTRSTKDSSGVEMLGQGQAGVGLGGGQSGLFGEQACGPGPAPILSSLSTCRSTGSGSPMSEPGVEPLGEHPVADPHQHRRDAEVDVQPLEGGQGDQRKLDVVVGGQSVRVDDVDVGLGELPEPSLLRPFAAPDLLDLVAPERKRQQVGVLEDVAGKRERSGRSAARARRVRTSGRPAAGRRRTPPCRSRPAWPAGPAARPPGFRSRRSRAARSVSRSRSITYCSMIRASGAYSGKPDSGLGRLTESSWRSVHDVRRRYGLWTRSRATVVWGP